MDISTYKHFYFWFRFVSASRIRSLLPAVSKPCAIFVISQKQSDFGTFLVLSLQLGFGSCQRTIVSMKIYLQRAFVNAKVYAKAQNYKLNFGDVIEGRIFFALNCKLRHVYKNRFSQWDKIVRIKNLFNFNIHFEKLRNFYFYGFYRLFTRSPFQTLCLKIENTSIFFFFGIGSTLERAYCLLFKKNKSL